MGIFLFIKCSSKIAKCQGFLRREGNLVLSDGGVAVRQPRRTRDFYSRVGALLCSYEVDFVVRSLDDECRMLVCQHVVQRQERQFRLLYIAVIIERLFNFTDSFTLQCDAGGRLLK